MIANFYFKKNGLSVEFINTSIGNPTSYSWDFGDGSDLSTDQSPTHVYTSAGFYEVILKVEDELNNNDSISSWIGVYETSNDVNDIPLIRLIQQYIPSFLSPIIEAKEKLNLIRKWQDFIRPLVNSTIEVEDVYNELAYPSLVNHLIAQLTVYDLIIISANQYMLKTTQESAEENDGGSGEVKKITTGPSDVEWFSSSETWKNLFKGGGLFYTLTSSICALSARLRIQLYFCNGNKANDSIGSDVRIGLSVIHPQRHHH